MNALVVRSNSESQKVSARTQSINLLYSYFFKLIFYAVNIKSL